MCAHNGWYESAKSARLGTSRLGVAMKRARGTASARPILAQARHPMRFWMRGYSSSANVTSPSPAKLVGMAISSVVSASPPCAAAQSQFRRVC